MLSTLRDLHLVRTLRRAFRGLPVELHMKPASDPTLLFAGIIYGPKAFLDSGLYRLFWDLKRALFFHGDAIVEAYLAKFGLPALRETYTARRADDRFFTFPDEALRALGCGDSHERLVLLYDEVARGCDGMAALNAESRRSLLAGFVAATNAAIESTFLQDEWETIDFTNPSHGSHAIDVAAKVEQAKNVRVVTTLCGAKRLFEGVPVYPHGDEEIVARTSRWFTLLDDLIDLRSDLATRQPNYVIAYALRAGELRAIRQSLESDSRSPVSPGWLRHTAPTTAARYQRSYAEARQNFVAAFPVLPRWMAFAIERRARRKGESPF